MKEITMETARQIAARIWCDPEYSHIEMNTTLAENIALLLFGENYRQADKDNMFAGQSAEPKEESDVR